MTHGVINPYKYEGKGRYEGLHKGGGPRITRKEERKNSMHELENLRHIHIVNACLTPKRKSKP
jgi:hypothetical protein